MLPGMRLGEALATCPGLVLVEPDPAAAEQAWEEIVCASRTRLLGRAGDAGVAYFETRGVERLYGGLEPALQRALGAAGSGVGRADRRRRAQVHRARGRVGRAARPGARRPRRRGRELPRTAAADPAPIERRQYHELEGLGVRKLGQLAGLPGGAVAERLGPDGRRAWSLARGGTDARVRGRRPPAELVESLEFPEAIGNELTLRRALGALVDTALARPERRDRFVRKVALSARLVGGGSWRRALTLREPSAEADRIRIALAPKLAELPAPVVELRLELVN